MPRVRNNLSPPPRPNSPQHRLRKHVRRRNRPTQLRPIALTPQLSLRHINDVGLVPFGFELPVQSFGEAADESFGPRVQRWYDVPSSAREPRLMISVRPSDEERMSIMSEMRYVMKRLLMATRCLFLRACILRRSWSAFWRLRRGSPRWSGPWHWAPLSSSTRAPFRCPWRKLSWRPELWSWFWLLERLAQSVLPPSQARRVCDRLARRWSRTLWLNEQGRNRCLRLRPWRLPRVPCMVVALKVGSWM